MESFEALDHWVKELEETSHKDILKYVVGNKCDLSGKEEVSIKLAA